MNGDETRDAEWKSTTGSDNEDRTVTAGFKKWLAAKSAKKSGDITEISIAYQ